MFSNQSRYAVAHLQNASGRGKPGGLALQIQNKLPVHNEARPGLRSKPADSVPASYPHSSVTQT